MKIVSDEYEEFLLNFLKQDPNKPQVAYVLKTQEECGEVAEVFLAYSNWLWRKENGATAWDVCMELADLAMTAMIAMVAMGYGPDQLLRAQMEKTLGRMRDIAAPS